jgi:hypothetical protein
MPRFRLWIEWLGWLVAFAVLSGGHFVWMMRCNDPVIAQRFGAALIVLGIGIAARPFLRTGLKTSVDHAMPGGSLPYYVSHEMLAERATMQKAARPGILFDILAEKVVGVSCVLIGTVINGYGDIFAKVWGVGQ